MAKKEKEEKKTKRYTVALPVTGIVYVTVEADDGDEAIETAICEGDWDVGDIDQLEACRSIVTGNVFHGVMNDAEITDEEEIEA